MGPSYRWRRKTSGVSRGAGADHNMQRGARLAELALIVHPMMSLGAMVRSASFSLQPWHPSIGGLVNSLPADGRRLSDLRDQLFDEHVPE